MEIWDMSKRDVGINYHSSSQHGVSIYPSCTHYTSGSTPPTSKMFRTHIAPETLVACMETLHFGTHMVPFIVIRG